MTASYHSHAPWRKAILIPFWTLQLGFELLIIGLIALAAGFLNRYFDDTSYIEDGEGDILEVDYADLDNTEHMYEVSIPAVQKTADFRTTESSQSTSRF